METNPGYNPRAEIEVLRNEIMMMGANDSEYGEIDAVLSDFDAGKITGPEAVKKVREIKGRKMAYH